MDETRAIRVNPLTAATLAAVDYLKANSKFNELFLQYWATVEPLPDAEAWPILDDFRAQVQVYRFDYNRKDVGIKHAASELYRLVRVGQSAHTFETLNRFVVWYDKLTNDRIPEAIGCLFDYHGDGFSDLCDLLPLAGKGVVERCLSSAADSPDPRAGFLMEKELTGAVKLACEQAATPMWTKFILDGEEYVSSTLDSQARRWFLNEVWFSQSEEDGSLFEHVDLGDD